MTNSIDTVKAVATYIVALVIVIGGFMILFATRSETTGADTRIIIAGFMGSAVTFVFSSETQTRTARQAAAATYAANVTNGVAAAHERSQSGDRQIPQEVQIVNPNPVPVTVKEGIDNGQGPA